MPSETFLPVQSTRTFSGSSPHIDTTVRGVRAASSRMAASGRQSESSNGRLERQGRRLARTRQRRGEPGNAQVGGHAA